MTSGALAAGKLVLFLALHSSSLALEKDELSLTGGQKRKRGEERLQERLAQAAALMHQVRKPEQEFLLPVSRAFTQLDRVCDPVILERFF